MPSSNMKASARHYIKEAFTTISGYRSKQHNMKVISILVCVVGASYALYPNPNYESIVTTIAPPKPSVEYGPPVTTTTPKKPEENYGVPNPPISSYGPPSKIFDVDFDVDDSDEVPESPSTSYGIPPRTSYGVPLQPQIPTKKYEIASTPDFPPKVVQMNIPSTSYGVPVQRVSVPSFSLKVPFRKNSGSSVVVPAKEEHEETELKIPSTSYGVPVKFREEYELPSVRVPATVYGLPNVD